MSTIDTGKTYDPESVVEIIPFTRQKDGDDIIIGNRDAAIFVAVPPGAVEVLDCLATGMSVGEAANRYREQHGEACDVAELLTVLETKGFVSPSTEAVQTDMDQLEQLPLHGSGATLPAFRRFHFTTFPQTLAARIFSPQMIGLALGLILISSFLLACEPSLWPRSDDLYDIHLRTFTIIILAGCSYAGVLVHEFGHLVAARAVGVNSRISIGNRLYELVMEADLTLLWAIPKSQRYLPLLAGCLVDAVTAALLVQVLYANRRGWLPMSSAVPLLRIILLSYAARILWQGLVFVRTDLYYILVTMLNCRNLLRDTEDYLRNQLAKFLPGISIVDQSAIHTRERVVIRFYSVIWIVGRVLALYWLIVVPFPLVCRYTADLAKALARYSNSPGRFWDGFVSLTLLAAPGVVGCFAWLRNSRAFRVFCKRKELSI